MAIDDYFPEEKRGARNPIALGAERAPDGQSPDDGQEGNAFYLSAKAADKIIITDTGKAFSYRAVKEEAKRVAEILERQRGYKVNIDVLLL